MNFARFLSAALLGALGPGLLASTLFTLGSGKAVEKSHVDEFSADGQSGYVLKPDSRLRFALDGDPLAAKGTLLFAVSPDDRFGADKKSPSILLQLGGNHWEPNSLTVFREKDNRLIFTFFGHQKRVFIQCDGGRLKKNQINTLAVAWDGEKIRFFLNGSRLASEPSPVPIQFGKDRLSVGGPAVAKPGWNFSGRISALELDDEALPDAAVIARMRGFLKPLPAPLAETVPYVREVKGLVRIGNGMYELQVTSDGQPQALYDKLAGRFLIRDWNLAGGNWWSFTGTEKGKSRDISNRDFKGTFSTRDGVAAWSYAVPENGTVFTVSVKPEANGTLRFHYTLDNQFSQPVQMVYFPQLGGFDKGNDSWAFLPRWTGVKRDLRNNFKFMCWGGPGHLSMLLIALKLDNATLMLYPQDPKGCVRFATIDDRNSGPDGFAIMSWQNRDWIQPGERYAGSADFVLANAGDRGLRGVAEEYRAWAEKQPWFMTFREKCEKYPNAAKILNGVIKMGGFEAIGTDSSVYEPSIAGKEKTCNLTYDYNRFIEVARRIESVYGVKPAYRYDGWWDRFDSRYPDYFPVNPRLGDFSKFLKANNGDGRLVYFHMNPIQYDFQTEKFDVDKQAMSPGGGYQEQVWSRNRLYVASPRPAMADEVAAVRKMREYGAKGIFEDVIGSTTMLDVNPKGGYPYWHRDSGTAALLELAAALRKESGDAFRGTEGGEERRMPYYDAFMMGAGNSECVPFINMVYGDCIVNATGIEGGGSGNKPHERARNILFGIVLGLDGRHAWATKEYMPSAQMIFETQNLLKETAGVRMVDFRNHGNLCISEWPRAFSIANIGKDAIATGSFTHEGLGKIELSGVAGESAVFVAPGGRFAVWGIGTLSLGGKTLFEIGGKPEEIAVSYDGKRLAVGNLSPTPVSVTLNAPGAKVEGKAEYRPSGKQGTINLSKPFSLAVGEVVFIR